MHPSHHHGPRNIIYNPSDSVARSRLVERFNSPTTIHGTASCGANNDQDTRRSDICSNWVLLSNEETKSLPWQSAVYLWVGGMSTQLNTTHSTDWRFISQSIHLHSLQSAELLLVLLAADGEQTHCGWQRDDSADHLRSIVCPSTWPLNPIRQIHLHPFFESLGKRTSVHL